MLLQIGGSKLRSSLNSLKTDFTQENYYFPVIIIDMYHKKRNMLLDKYYKHNGAQFLVLQTIMSSIPQFHKIIIYCMIEKEESIMFMKTKKFKREFKKSLVSLCRKKNRQYLMILQFIAYYRFFFSQFWFPL